LSARSALAYATARGHWMMPRLAGRIHTAVFVNTRLLDRAPNDMCPLGARRIELTNVHRVGVAYQWGGSEPGVLATHGWGTDSTTMSSIANVAVAQGESVVCFDAPGHGVSSGSQATVGEYTDAVDAVLQRFPSIHTVIAHSLSAIAVVAAIARSKPAGIQSLLFLAPACSLSGVLDRWSAQRRLPAGVAALIANELHRRDGVPISHWDITTLDLDTDILIRIVHDPQDRSVPISDALQIAAGGRAQLSAAPRVGHHGILSSEQARGALTSLLEPRVICKAPLRKAIP
jgi:pimeloyl-ACP methyl ester carboxylesterase